MKKELKWLSTGSYLLPILFLKTVAENIYNTQINEYINMKHTLIIIIKYK